MGTKVEKEMKTAEDSKEILRKYKQYLKLEKSLSANTIDAYLTDLDKLLRFLSQENIHILDVAKRVFCQASVHFTVILLWMDT